MGFPAIQKPRSLVPRTSSWLTFPNCWSTSDAKRRRFAEDPYFQETLVELSRQCVSQASGHLENKSFLIFKPDAAVVRCVHNCLTELARHNIRPIHGVLVRFDRHTFRELWRYELNASTYERYSAVDALLGRSPSLFVLLESDDFPSCSTFAAHLNEFKGPSLVSMRREHHLRSRIHAGDGVLNHIHTPEDLLDVVREIGVLFDRPQRTEIITKLCAPYHPPAAMDDLIAEFYSHDPPHDLSLSRVRSKVFPEMSDAAFEEFLEEAARLCDFEEFVAQLSARCAVATWWDAFVLFIARRLLSVEDVVPVLEYENQQRAGLGDTCRNT
jgi:hypothetical protein